MALEIIFTQISNEGRGHAPFKLDIEIFKELSDSLLKNKEALMQYNAYDGISQRKWDLV